MIIQHSQTFPLAQFCEDGRNYSYADMYVASLVRLHLRIFLPINKGERGALTVLAAYVLHGCLQCLVSSQEMPVEDRASRFSNACRSFSSHIPFLNQLFGALGALTMRPFLLI